LFSSSFSSKAGVDAGVDATSSENEPETTKERTGATALIFDTETTGMVRFRNPYTDPSQPDLVQLGFLMVDTSDWKIRNQGSFLVQLRDSTVGIEEGAKRVHGISEQDCSDFGIQHETVLDLFENLCSNADVIVGHNIRFDAIVMKTAFFRGRSSDNSYSEVLSSKRQICTMMESIDLCKLPPKSSSSSNKSTPYKWPSLGEAYKFVTGGDRGESGETLEGAHDALVDSEACLKVFRYLVEHGHVSVEEETPAKSPDSIASEATTAGKLTTPIATLQKTERPAVSSDDSAAAASPATEPSTDIEAANDGFDSNPEEMHNYDTPERNGGTDRSSEVEETAAHDQHSVERNGGLDRSKEIEEAAAFEYNAAENNESIDRSSEAEKTTVGSPRPFDPSSFSSDMLETGAVTNKNSSSSSPSASDQEGGFRVRGNTYEHKEMIKQLGGRWNSQSKEWVFRESQYLSKLESYEDLTIERFSDE
jgi:DNA polymerase-3 subunit epsilon